MSKAFLLIIQPNYNTTNEKGIKIKTNKSQLLYYETTTTTNYSKKQQRLFLSQILSSIKFLCDINARRKTNRLRTVS